MNPGPGPTALTQGPGTLGLASNPGPAWQAGPGFWARPRVPGPRFLRPGPWVWALGLGPLGLYCDRPPEMACDRPPVMRTSVFAVAGQVGQGPWDRVQYTPGIVYGPVFSPKSSKVFLMQMKKPV